jgi:hypothetical protein
VAVMHGDRITRRRAMLFREICPLAPMGAPGVANMRNSATRTEASGFSGLAVAEVSRESSRPSVALIKTFDEPPHFQRSQWVTDP